MHEDFPYYFRCVWYFSKATVNTVVLDLERYDADRKALFPLPDTAFDTAKYETVVTDKWGRFTMESEKYKYSVSSDHSETTVMLKITATQVVLMDTQ